MRSFNKEDYEIAKKYEADLIRAVESRYARNIMTVEFDEINRIYWETLNRRANQSCGGCVLQMLTSVGRLYLTFKKKMEEEAKKEELQKKVVVQDVVQEEEHIDEVPEHVEEVSDVITEEVEEVQVQEDPVEEVQEQEVSQKPRTRSRRTSNKNKEDNKDVHKDKIETQVGEGNPGDESNN